MTDVPHLGFILAAYAVTLLVLGGATLAIVLDARTQKRLLAELERRRAARGRSGLEQGGGR